MTIADGSVVVAGHLYDNVVPVPLEAQGASRIDLHGTRGEGASLTGESVAIVLTGEPTYVEEFPGATRG
jgi:hypothetical protein